MSANIMFHLPNPRYSPRRVGVSSDVRSRDGERTNVYGRVSINSEGGEIVLFVNTVEQVQALRAAITHVEDQLRIAAGELDVAGEPFPVNYDAYVSREV